MRKDLSWSIATAFTHRNKLYQHTTRAETRKGTILYSPTAECEQPGTHQSRLPLSCSLPILWRGYRPVVPAPRMVVGRAAASAPDAARPTLLWRGPGPPSTAYACPPCTPPTFGRDRPAQRRTGESRVMGVVCCALWASCAFTSAARARVAAVTAATETALGTH